MNIECREELLESLAQQLHAVNGRTSIENLEIVLHVGAFSYSFSFAQGFDVLIGDLFWDERGDWSDADRLELKEI